VDAASVAAAHGREVQRFAFKRIRLYEDRSVVASKARAGGDQKSSLGRARKELAGSVGARRVRALTRETQPRSSATAPCVTVIGTRPFAA
jgi:hypothetical protein